MCLAPVSLCINIPHPNTFLLRLLQHEPHHVYVILCMAPVSLCINIPHPNTFLLSFVNSSYSSGNFSCDKCWSSPRALVIKQDTVICVNSVCFSIVDDGPISKLLRDCVRRTGIKRGGFGLGDFLNFSIEL